MSILRYIKLMYETELIIKFDSASMFDLKLLITSCTFTSQSLGKLEAFVIHLVLKAPRQILSISVQ